jgi:opacity protein-like surface antigen
MIKKAVFFGLLVSALGTNPTQANTNLFNSGFLLGAQVGYNYGYGSFNVRYDDGLPPPMPEEASGRGQNSAALIGLIGAYRYLFTPGYTVGLEVTANYIGMNEIHKRFLQVTTPLFLNRLKRTYNVIPSVALGAIVSDNVLLSLGLGLGISRFHLLVDNVARGNTVNYSTTKLGFAPSLGVEYATTQKFSLIANATYEMYQKVSKTFDSRLAIARSSYMASINPKYLTVKAGFVFKF